MEQTGNSGTEGPTPPPRHGPAGWPGKAHPRTPQGRPGRPGQSPAVHVVNRPMSFGRLVGALLTSLSMLGLVFVIGMGAGLLLIGLVGLLVAGPGLDQWILRETYREGGGDTVAVIPVNGIIDAYQAEFVRYCVDEVLADSSVRAVVLQVDSPGGGMTPSDRIWNRIGRLKDAGLPIVASYGGVAASGGYYVSCDADYIMAEETCITGSIGVIAQIMTFEGLLDKVGVEPVTLVASGSPEKSIANDIWRSWTEEDRHTIMTMLDSAYEIFHRRVKDGRGDVITDAARLNEIADGSIYTAQQAQDNGLIDGIGYLDDAIAQAEQMAGIPVDSATVEILYERPRFLGGFPLVQAMQDRRKDPLDPERLRTLVNDLSRVRIMYLMH